MKLRIALMTVVALFVVTAPMLAAQPTSAADQAPLGGEEAIQAPGTADTEVAPASGNCAARSETALFADPLADVIPQGFCSGGVEVPSCDTYCGGCFCYTLGGRSCCVCQ